MDSIVDLCKKKRGNPGPPEPVSGLEFRFFDPAADGALYNAWRRDAWRCAHGTEDGYEDVYLAYAAVRSRHDPEAVLIALKEGEPCGILELDMRRGVFHGAGWISFFYLAEKARGQGLGRALMEKAEAVYRERGRKKLSLTVAEDNRRALGFYLHLGFHKVSRQMGALTWLYEMERPIP